MTNVHWARSGGGAGIVYVLGVAAAAALTERPPGSGASNRDVQAFFIDHSAAVVAQAWLYALATVLIVWFALVVRRVLFAGPSGRHLGDLFFVGTVAVAALSFVAMSIRIVAARAAEQLSPSAVRGVGADFSLVMLALCGFLVAAAAISYAAAVLADGMLPRWTGWLAALAAVVNLAGTLSVFVPSGPFSVEGGLTTWLPVSCTAAWYLGVAVSLLRSGGHHAAPAVARSGTD
ncbi:hypothetical protein ACXDF8_25975 [Mycolicibacterium sp. CBM1]